MTFEWPPVEADPRKRHLALVQHVFEGYHDHTRRFLALLDSDGSAQSKRTLERLVVAAERLLGSFADVIAMLRSWETADGLEAIRLAVVLELVIAVDKLNRQVIARAKVLSVNAEDEPPPVELDVGAELRTLTEGLLAREESYREQIASLNVILDRRKPVLCEMDLDVMAWEMEDGRDILNGNVERIRRWAKDHPARDVEARAAIDVCKSLLGCCAEVVRMVSMLRGHTIDRFLVTKPGAPKAPVN